MKDTKLTPSMRDALVVCAADLLRAFSFWQGVPSFMQSRFTGIPDLKSPTQSGRALVRLELIQVDRETHAITLTEKGKAILETVITDEERKALVRIAEEHERSRAWAEKQDRKRKWLADTENERRAWREEADRLWQAIREDSDRVRDIAWLIGRGANNVDELLVELRERTIRHDQNRAAVDEHDNRQPKFEDGSTY